MNDIKWKIVFIGIILTLFAQVGAWVQHNLQFKYTNLNGNWWGWYLLSIPLTWLFIHATKYNVDAFGGSIWAGRFIGFIVGIVVYAILTNLVFNQPMTAKIWIQLILCCCILGVQIFWK